MRLSGTGSGDENSAMATFETGEAALKHDNNAELVKKDC